LFEIIRLGNHFRISTVVSKNKYGKINPLIIIRKVGENKIKFEKNYLTFNTFIIITVPTLVLIYYFDCEYYEFMMIPSCFEMYLL